MRRVLVLGLMLAGASCSDEADRAANRAVPNIPLAPDAVTIQGEAPSNLDGAAITPPEQLRVVEFVLPSALGNCTEGASFPHDPAVDTLTGLVYYTDTSRHCIGQLNPDTLEVRAWPTATPGVEPHGLVVVDGVVYYTGWVADILGVIVTATGSSRDFSLGVAEPHTPTWQQGAVWFTGGERQYGRFDPITETTQLFDFPTAQSGPYGIAPAPDGSVWVALFGSNRLARIDPSASPVSAEEYVLPKPGARPRRLAVDARGRVWYSDYPGRELGSMDPAAPLAERFAQFPTPRGGRPYGIAVGPDQRIWYGDQDRAEVVGFDPASQAVVAELPLELAAPGPIRNMATDPERQRIWIALSDVGRLGVIQF